MGKIFNYDSKFFAGMTKVSDTIIINILFVICSIPIEMKIFMQQKNLLNNLNKTLNKVQSYG